MIVIYNMTLSEHPPGYQAVIASWAYGLPPVQAGGTAAALATTIETGSINGLRSSACTLPCSIHRTFDRIERYGMPSSQYVPFAYRSRWEIRIELWIHQDLLSISTAPQGNISRRKLSRQHAWGRAGSQEVNEVFNSDL